MLKRFIFIAAVFLFLEVSLRLVFGFGDLAVYEVSEEYEYAIKPSQSFRRFGNTYMINEAGMRSDPLNSGENRILKFGDSVLNGGTTTDQGELASSILERRFSEHQSVQNMRVLNISAGSWGPDNAFAWLRQNGDFGARAIVLVFSSHDWQDQMEFKNVVGNIPFYPSQKPLLAITDAFSWLYSRYFQRIAWNEIPPILGAVPEKHAYNPGWERFIDYTSARSIPLIVYHHATLKELDSATWSPDGIQLQAYLSSKGVTTISGLEAGFDVTDFRDEIHPNAKGQVKIANALEPVLKELLKDE